MCVRTEDLIAVKMLILVFGLWGYVDLQLDTNVLEEHTAFIFRAKK
jgi:hypothetical protein